MDNCSGTSSGCTASYNSALGSKAGQSGTAANANKTGDHNTFLGALSGPGSTTQLTNATAIGANAIVSRDNALVLGSIGGLNGAKGSVNVGIGTHNPTTTLQVAGGDMSTATAGKGLIVRSPDGTKCARIGIDNSGVLVASAITCP